jgi:erythromycin esterase-like protein
MSQPAPTPHTHATLDEWIAREAIPFSLDAPATFDSAVDQVIASLGDSVALLGLGEALHGGSEILALRNRLLQRLVEAHGYSAIAIESSFPRSHLVDEYVAGRGPASYEDVRDSGFSHGFGRLDSTRALVEWMRAYNADPAHPVTLRFYGFDSPTEMSGTESPRQLLGVALDYLAALDPALATDHHGRIEPLLGEDAAWENPAAMMDPAQSIGRSPAATALRAATEDLIAELQLRRPDLATRGDLDHYLEAVQHATMARQLLAYHAELARPSSQRTARLLGMRDTMMADALSGIVARERGRGKVLAFAHNSHLQRGQARWQLGPDLLTWWPAGAHLDATLGARYAIIGTAVGVSAANGIAAPGPGTPEAKLTAAPGPARFIPTHRGRGLPADELASLPTRSPSTRNSTYFALTPQSLADFDWLAILDSTAYDPGAPPLP